MESVRYHPLFMCKEKQMYFDVDRNSFLIDGVDEIPGNAIKIDDDQAEAMM